MLFAFDLDDTLILSKRAVVAAYRAAGVSFKAEYWGLPWDKWCTPAQHEKKNEVYPSMLAKYAAPGPALLFYHALRIRGVPVTVVTAASLAGAEAALQLCQIPVVELAGFGLSVEEKQNVLHLRSAEGYYIDSDPAVAYAVVKGLPYWRALITAVADH